MLQSEEFNDEPCYVISVAARMVGVHEQTLRYYERVGLITPSRSQGRHRLFSPREIEMLRRIKTLTDDMGLNLAGAQVVMNMMESMGDMEREILRLLGEVDRLRLQNSQELKED